MEHLMEHPLTATEIDRAVKALVQGLYGSVPNSIKAQESRAYKAVAGGSSPSAPTRRVQVGGRRSWSHGRHFMVSVIVGRPTINAGTGVCLYG